MSAPARLADCGRRPNCISSTASNPRRRIGPWSLRVDPEQALEAAAGMVEQLPRTTIVERNGHYLRAESRSRVFRFVDDLELLVESDPGRLAVRSASRIGYSDRGVNRRRVKALQAALVAAGVIAE